MKPVRSLPILLGILFGFVLAAGALLFTPAVQRWALLRAMQARPALQFEAATVAASLSQVQLGGVRFKKSGITVQIGQLEADYSLWQLLLKRQLVLGRLTGRGLLVDASKLSARRANAAAAGVPAATPGLLTQIKLPVGLVLADCVLEGRVLLPGSTGGPPVEATCQISGGQIAPGQEGELVLAADLKNPAAAARVTALRAELRLRVRQTEQKTFSHVSLTAVVETEGRDLPGQEHLKIAASLAKTAGGENYEFTVDTLLGGKAEKVLALNATLPAGGKEYAGSWQLLARTAQLEPFFLGAGLPDFQARGEGRFSFTPGTGAVGLQGSLSAEVNRLEAWEPAWRAFGAVKLAAQFDVAGVDGVARLNLLQFSVVGDQPVLELSAARGAEINLKERRLQLGSSAGGEALTLTLHGLPLAWVRPFVQAVDISGGMITGQLTITGQSDSLLLRAVQPLRVSQLNAVQAGQLLLHKADLAVGFDAVLTKTELQATVSSFTLKTLSGDSLTAQAKVTLPTGPDPSVTIVAGYKTDMPTLLAPVLKLGPIQSTGEIDFTLEGKKIELRRLAARIHDDHGFDMFQATALRPFTFNLATRQAAIIGTPDSKMVLRLDFARLPLAALPLSLPGAKLGGFVADGELVLEVDGDKVRVRAPHPFILNNVSLQQNGRQVLTGLRVEAQPLLELTSNTSARFETGTMVVMDGNGAMLAGLNAEAARSTDSGLTGSLNFTLEVPALATQPIFAGTRAVSAGRASGEVRVALGSARQVEARLTVNGLVASASNEILPVANLSFRAVAQPDGKIAVQAPLLLDRAGVRSDLGLAVDLSPAGRGYLLEGKLTGQQVELTDALAVLGVFMASAAETPLMAEPAVQPSVVADAKPAWSRLTGRLALEVKSVMRGADWAMSGLTGLVVIEPADITLQKLEATFGEKGRFAAKGLVSFTRGPQPYDLAGDFSLTEFDAGKLFTALDPAKPATIEGMFTVAARFTGNGETLGRTLERSQGTFELTGRQGIFRGLQRTTNKVSLATKAVDLVGSLFGSSKVVEKVAGAAYHVDQLAQTLGELNYDQLNVKLVRDQSLNVALEDISLVAPEIRLIGKGTVTYVPGKPLLQQPLSLALSMAGRGKVEEQLGKLRLLNGARDDLDYARTKETLTLGGTLARPDPTVFFTRLATAKLGDLLAPEN
jgi:hypothetical protein